MAAISTILQQVVNSPLLYINGLHISAASNTTLSIEAGQARDSTNTFDIVVPTALTLNAAVIGANGLDTGTLTASKLYYVYLIYDVQNNKPVASLLSLSATAPFIPGGYSASVKIGVWAVDGAAHFYVMYQSGNDVTRLYQYDTPVTVLTSGVATTATAIDLTPLIPFVNRTTVLLNTSFLPGAASRTATISNTAIITGQVASVALTEQRIGTTHIASTVIRVTYSVSNSDSALTVALQGFLA